MDHNFLSISIKDDLEYLVVFSLVLILPKILLKFKIPSGITALFIGICVGHLAPEIKYDQLFRFLSHIGITSLFVFSGLEVNLSEVKRDRSYILVYLLKSSSAVFLISWGLQHFLNLPYQESLILSLGIFTPSAGFIIHSLHSFKVGHDQEYWIKSKAISKEVISIIFLLIALQSHNLKALSFSIIFFIGLFLFLPMIFKFFFRFVSPYAPNSEVTFLVAISLISGVISKELGAYYLVGAFIVGLIGSRFKSDIFKDESENILSSLSSFFNVFLPFYFFYSGVKLSFDGFNQQAILYGMIFVIIFIPLRLILNNSSIKYFLKDFTHRPYTISLSLMPTLIFGLIVAGILKERGHISSDYIYALIFYTLFSSLLPSIMFSFQKSNGEKTENENPT